jgi:hypothetical protein
VKTGNAEAALSALTKLAASLDTSKHFANAAELPSIKIAKRKRIIRRYGLG